MSAADEIVLVIRTARAAGKSEAEVAAIARRLGEQYSTADLKAAQAELAAGVARGER
jgi:hypothetical protein